ncbi:hypothetical protein [Edaphobacter bradus]|uniref:hypothetical protein n=1 Tax=Edaphobacter bradus TaxID=2259016 RepID=UPI0021E0B9AE|nr:hypothetical protein [Edaphobacter bradus]
MPTSFDKAQTLQAQYAAERDPALKDRIGKALDRYYAHDLKEERQKLRIAKPHYGLARVLVTLTVCLVVLFCCVAAVEFFFPALPVSKTIIAAVAVFLVVAAFGLLVLGRLSEEGASGVVGHAVSLLTGGLKPNGISAKPSARVRLPPSTSNAPVADFETDTKTISAAAEDASDEGASK